MHRRGIIVPLRRFLEKMSLRELFIVCLQLFREFIIAPFGEGKNDSQETQDSTEGRHLAGLQCGPGAEM